MAGNTKVERDFCISCFPELARDSAFKVTSDEDDHYNCIGFAIGYNDLWIAIGRDNIPWFWWPDSVPYNREPNSLVKTFMYFGFEECADDKMEEGYDKVALYSKNGFWTHAARIIGNGLYHSKLGESFDILHSPGNVMDQTVDPRISYGKPFAYMKRKVSDRHLLIAKKPTFGYLSFMGHRIPYMAPSKADPTLLNRLIAKAISQALTYKTIL